MGTQSDECNGKRSGKGGDQHEPRHFNDFKLVSKSIPSTRCCAYATSIINKNKMRSALTEQAISLPF